MVQLSHLYMTTSKTMALIRQTFVSLGLLPSSHPRSALSSLLYGELPLFSPGLDFLFSGSLAFSFLFYYLLKNMVACIL